jgi:hypothetical protein
MRDPEALLARASAQLDKVCEAVGLPIGGLQDAYIVPRILLLQAERDRCRATLEQIVRDSPDHENQSRAIARAALNPEAKECHTSATPAEQQNPAITGRGGHPMSTEPFRVDPDQQYTPAGSTSYILETEATTQDELECAADAVLGALANLAPHLNASVGSSGSSMTIGVTCDTPPHLEASDSSLQADIRKLLNRHSAEAGSDTPDFILAEYLTDALHLYERAVIARERWYGRGLPMAARKPTSGQKRDSEGGSRGD